jgi:uncharacterized protein (TIGR02284 family)
MVTTVGLETRIEELLADLIQLDFDAAAAYGAAIERVERAEYRAALSEFRDDHLRHTRELGECMRQLGHEPPRSGDAKEMLTKGKVLVGGLLGDRAVLEAMRSNEEDTVTAYDRAVDFSGLPENVRNVIAHARADEHRHRHWIVSQTRSA